MLESLRDVFGVVLLGDHCEEGGLVEGPSLVSASCLHERRQVGVGDVEAGQPDHFRLLNLVPVLVLFVAAEEVLEPADQVLEGLRSESQPVWWHHTVENAAGQVIESLRHTDLTDKGTLKIHKRVAHKRQKNIESLKFLQQHNLCGHWHIKLLLDVEDVELVGQLILNVLRDLADVLFAVDAVATATVGGLHAEDINPKLFDGVGEVLNFGVGVETEHVGVREQRNLVDFLLDLFFAFSLVRNHVVEVRLGEEELLVGVKDEITHKFFQVCVQYASIVVVSDTTTVHGLTNQVAEGGPRQLLLIRLDSLVQVEGDQIPGDSEVRVIEVVIHVPANLAELLALLDSSMEEGKHIDHGLVLFLGALCQVVLSQLGVGHTHVSLKTIWGLSHDFE